MPSRNGGAASGGQYHVVPIQLLAAFCCMLLLALPAAAQSTAGRILGTVTDQSGAAVGGATVVVTDVQRGASRTLTTDDSGDYVAAELQPGT